MCGAAENNTCTKVTKTSQLLQGIQRAEQLNHPELERERERENKDTFDQTNKENGKIFYTYRDVTSCNCG